MNFNLIIWDFDGVIADTEKLWLKNRMNTINEKFGLKWDYETTYNYLGGMSDKTKRVVLDSMGLHTNDAFWEENYKLDQIDLKKGFKLTDDIEKIFKYTVFKQCIATGGLKEKTNQKIDIVGIRKYFPEKNVFTADMVEKGKPEPDLFLLAAEKMNEKPENCLVIEDSIAGIKAAIKAKMNVIAFVGYENRLKTLDEIKKLGIKNIFSNMSDIYNFLSNIC